MFRILTLLLSIGFLLCVSGFCFAHSRTWPGKQLGEALPEAATFAQKQASLTTEQISWVEKNLGEALRTEDRTPSFYLGTSKDGAIVGTAIFIDAIGVNGKIEMGLAIDSAGQVMRVVLFEHSESSRLAANAFLKQFAGKKAAQKFKVGVDVTSPSGDEKSAQIVATAVRRGLLLAMAGLRLGGK